MEARVYLTKAEYSLKAAELCFENGLYDDAVSRAYYSVLHSAVALLVKLGLTPTTRRIPRLERHSNNEKT
ncbi:MAG: HEPN domain-containing protein [bacterium]